MIVASVNLMYASIQLMQKMEKHNLKTISQLLQLPYSGLDPKDVLTFSQSCGWISADSSEQYSLTEKGLEILQIMMDEYDIPRSLQRGMLYDYAINCRPAWVNLTPRGRTEAYIMMTGNEKQCCNYAGLMDDEMDDVAIFWWDKVSMAVRSESDIEKLKKGREGEHLTIEYETIRTNHRPEWISLGSNADGYDVLSRVSSDNSRRLRIEVKASSKKITEASFFISKNEWNTATCGLDYCFYIWSIRETNRLAIIKPEEVIEHIPKDSGKGKWTDVEIPFSAFTDKFVESGCLLKLDGIENKLIASGEYWLE